MIYCICRWSVYPRWGHFRAPEGKKMSKRDDAYSVGPHEVALAAGVRDVPELQTKTRVQRTAVLVLLHALPRSLIVARSSFLLSLMHGSHCLQYRAVILPEYIIPGGLML